MQNDIIPKKRGRKPKNRDIVEEPVIINKKKKGRKPSGKIFEEMEVQNETHTESKSKVTTECIYVNLPLSESDIIKVTGKKVVNSSNVKISNKQISFIGETDMELENALEKTSKELQNLKDEFKLLEEKFKRFQYLEKIVSDNGIIDKEYHVPNDIVVNENGRWKLQTNIWCSWCCHSFDTIPVGLPESFCKTTKKFVVRDCFCSFNCAQAFNISLNDHKVWERFALLCRLKNIIFKGTEIENKQITSAPPRKLLDVFGGNKTIDELRNNRISVPKMYINHLPPAIPFFAVIEEIPLFFTRNQSTSVHDKLKSRNVNPSSLKSNAKTNANAVFSSGNIKSLFS